MDMNKIDPKLVVGALAVGAIALKMATAAPAGTATVSGEGGSLGAASTTRAAGLGEITLGNPNMTYDNAKKLVVVTVPVTATPKGGLDTLGCYVGCSALVPTGDGKYTPINFIKAEKTPVTILPGKTITVTVGYPVSYDTYQKIKFQGAGKTQLTCTAWSGFHANLNDERGCDGQLVCMDQPCLDRKNIEFA